MIKKRNALYLGKRDQDIVDYIKPLLSHYDFSSVVRDLIRDGIKYRKGMALQPSSLPSKPSSSSQNVLQSMNSSPTPSFEDIQLKEKELDLDDISDKLDLL